MARTKVGRKSNHKGYIQELTTKNGEKRYKGYITINGNRRTFTGKTKTEVNKWFDKVNHSADMGTYVKASGITFKTYLPHWLEHERAIARKESTVAEYERLARYDLMPFFENKKMDKITVSTINTYFDSVLAPKKLAPNTLRRKRTVLNKILSFAVSEGIIGFNPLLSIPNIKGGVRKERHALTPEELKALLNGAKSYYEAKKNYKSVNHSIYPFILLCAYTGARRGEVLALDWKDIDAENNTLRINKTLTEERQIQAPKTEHSKRVLTIPHWLAKKILSFNDGISPHIFHTKTGGYRTPSNMARAFDIVLSFAKLPPIDIHELRHTHASILIANGMSLADVSRRLGHANVSITASTYTHALDKTTQKASTVFDECVDFIG